MIIDINNWIKETNYVLMPLQNLFLYIMFSDFLIFFYIFFSFILFFFEFTECRSKNIKQLLKLDYWNYDALSYNNSIVFNIYYYNFDHLNIVSYFIFIFHLKELVMKWN